MEGEKGTVCVTGGTGFIASWLIKRLLEHGYPVNTTIRPDPEHKRDVSFLTSLPGASEKLQIFHADLDDPDSFTAAIKGCSGVFHVATPLDFEMKEPVEVITNRAVNGTLGILKACLNSKTVRRVVYTSSGAAVAFNGSDAEEMDESFWSDLDFVKSLKTNAESYVISKTLTEKAALEFAERHGLDLVTLIPSYVVGPFICPKFPSTVKFALAMVLGNDDDYQHLISTPMVHVDDVARAHIFLFENPEAKGRYNCSSVTITITEMSKFLSSRYSEYPIPTVDSLKEIKGHKSGGLSSKKLLDAGFEYKYGLEDIFDDAIQYCKENNYL